MLAGKSVTDEKDRLTVSELYSMRLDADLVTLSACETGLGKVSNGDDVVGLVRGFLYAGANRVISTLWEIDDEATSKLMVSFYKDLKAGKPKAESLRTAQLGLRKDFPHPRYWAAFQMTGGAENK
jgi:CHAT domain-containing protein